MILLCIYTLGFGSAAILGLASCPPLAERLKLYVQRRASEAKLQLDDIFVTFSPNRLQGFYLLAPVGVGLLGWLASGSWVMAAAGAAVGLLMPRLMVPTMKAQRFRKFHAQLVDSLLLLSSCLRAGLSMLQAFTVVAEEMPAPINQEFGLILKETRMGVSLDEAMIHFRQRMPSDDTNLFVTAVLVARETGGDVTAIFTRLVETLRERKKIKEKIKTLTFMARMQGIVMGILPVAFSYVTYTMDRSHFNFFLTDPLGKVLLIGVVAVQLFGAFLFMRFSKSPL